MVLYLFIVVDVYGVVATLQSRLPLSQPRGILRLIKYCLKVGWPYDFNQ